MGLSSSTLLHQTNYDGLRGIINSRGFKVSYSLEEIRAIGQEPLRAAFPMISFSDIPFSELGSHLYKYGGFTIGMKREWIKRVEFSPVCYFSQESRVLKELIVRLRYYLNIGETDRGEDYRLIAHLIAFIKNYEGYLRLRKKSKEYENYRFSDEREWRFVPEFSDLGQVGDLEREKKRLMLTEKEYAADREAYLGAIGNPVLPFKLTDINYIIVDKEHQIAYFKAAIQSAFADEFDEKMSWNDININFFTAKQIENDIFGLSHDVEFD